MASKQQRFMRRGVTKIFWLASVEAPKWLKRWELCPPNATELSRAVSEVDGWALSNEPIETPDMATTFTASIPGEDKADSSTLTFYEDLASNEIESLLPKGVAGFVVFLRKGDVPGSRSVDVFPAQVASRSAQYNTGNEAAKFQVTFTITEPPALDVPVPPAKDIHTLPAPADCDEEEGEGESVQVKVTSTTASATVSEDGES